MDQPESVRVKGWVVRAVVVPSGLSVHYPLDGNTVTFFWAINSKNSAWPVVMAHTFYFSFQEAEAGGSPEFEASQ